MDIEFLGLMTLIKMAITYMWAGRLSHRRKLNPMVCRTVAVAGNHRPGNVRSGWNKI